VGCGLIVREDGDSTRARDMSEIHRLRETHGITFVDMRIRVRVFHQSRSRTAHWCGRSRRRRIKQRVFDYGMPNVWFLGPTSSVDMRDLAGRQAFGEAEK
jgi:hypothetical protein